MVSPPSNDIQDTFQKEFSPPLDTSLIAAIVADYVNDGRNPSSDDVTMLRQILSQLAAQAENQIGEDDLVAGFANIQVADTTEDTISMADLFSTDESSTNTTTTSDASCSGQQPSSSPLRFLQTAFPDLPLSRLKSALGSVDDADHLDMEDIVESIISTEYARELEERGGEEVADTTDKQPDLSQLRQVGKKQKRRSGKTITLVDVRQKQHTRPSSTPSSPRVAAPDPWTQLSSVASHLEQLVPSRNAAYYQSMFHSPQYSSPSEALRAALASVAPEALSSVEMTPEETHMLFGMFDILQESAAYKKLPDVDREQMMSDAQLALFATLRRPDAALDVVWLLRELDGGEVDWGIYHSPAPTSPTIGTNGWQSKHVARLPSGPPAVAPPKIKTRAGTLSTPTSPISPSSQWETIPLSPRKTANPHADFIPAYNNKNAGTTKNHKQRAGELMQKRKEALREASRAWQRGNSSTRGGEVAFYFAERARNLQEQAQAEKLGAVWDMVQSSRTDTEFGVTIDLHGANISEAAQIVKTMLADAPPTALKPMKIITGRGKHSVNGVGVLGPAMKNTLIEDGWIVEKWSAGLIVRGRSSRRLGHVTHIS